MRDTSRPVQRGEAGFTLVEALVGLLVFSLIALMGAVVFSSTMGNQARVKERTQRLSEFERARALMRTDLLQATDRITRGPDGRPARSPFIGGDPWGENASLVAFVRQGYANPDGEARASIQYVEYRLVENRLLRFVRAAPDGAPFEAPQVLLADVAQAQVAFHLEGEWSDTWRGGAETPLPSAMRLDLGLADIGPVTLLFRTGP